MSELDEKRTFKKTRMQPIKSELSCKVDGCDGFMLHNIEEDANLKVDPPLMPHYCTKCSKKEWLAASYPRIAFEEL